VSTLTTDWQLRAATMADLDAIMAIETGTFTTDAWSKASMRAEIASPHTRYVVATDPAVPDEVAGYAGLLAPRSSAQADIQTIAVIERARRRGLGRLLMVTLIDEATTRGAGEVFLEVRADNPGAQALYLSLGFEELAVRTNYYQPDGVDAIIMRLTIAGIRPSTAVGA
jgi:ribosomal-protein-alanine acetyltransferase